MKIYNKFLIALLLFLNMGLCQLQCEIYEIRLTIENMLCRYCPNTVTSDLKKLKGVEDVKIWGTEGMGQIFWDRHTPFQCGAIYKIFYSTQFLLKKIDIDVEGVVEHKHGVLMLRSLPDNSLFYIDNGENLEVSRLKVGQVVRLQGTVTSNQGFNILNATSVLPELAPY